MLLVIDIYGGNMKQENIIKPIYWFINLLGMLFLIWMTVNIFRSSITIQKNIFAEIFLILQLEFLILMEYGRRKTDFKG